MLRKLIFFFILLFLISGCITTKDKDDFINKENKTIGTGDLKERGIIDNIDFTVYKNYSKLGQESLSLKELKGMTNYAYGNNLAIYTTEVEYGCDRPTCNITFIIANNGSNSRQLSLYAKSDKLEPVGLYAVEKIGEQEIPEYIGVNVLQVNGSSTAEKQQIGVIKKPIYKSEKINFKQTNKEIYSSNVTINPNEVRSFNLEIKTNVKEQTKFDIGVKEGNDLLVIDPTYGQTQVSTYTWGGGVTDTAT